MGPGQVSRFTRGVRMPRHRMSPQCLLGLHDMGPWQLRPPVVARVVPWMRWERSCRRLCGETDRRWFRVKAAGAKVTHLMAAEVYLRRLGMTAPDPDTLPSGTPPIEALLG